MLVVVAARMVVEGVVRSLGGDRIEEEEEEGGGKRDANGDCTID